MFDWQEDLDGEKVEKMAGLDIKPQVVLPDVERSIGPLKFSSEPYEVVNEKLPHGKGIFANVDVGDGVDRQIPMSSKSLRMQLAAERNRRGLSKITGMSVVIGAKMADIEGFGRTKVYWVRSAKKTTATQPAEETLD